jgi:hypothetical protein
MIHKKFAYHKPSPAGLADVNALREAYSDLLTRIEKLCPESRERAVAITHLELSAMCAIKAVVSNDPNSEVQS